MRQNKRSVRAARTAKRTEARAKRFSRRAKSFVKSNPVRIVVGATALGFVLAKLKHLF